MDHQLITQLRWTVTSCCFVDQCLWKQNSTCSNLLPENKWEVNNTRNRWLISAGFFFFLFSTFIQQQGLSIWEHDSLIFHSDFEMLLLEAQIAPARAWICSASAQSACSRSDILMLAQISRSPAPARLLALWAGSTCQRSVCSQISTFPHFFFFAIILSKFPIQ